MGQPAPHRTLALAVAGGLIIAWSAIFVRLAGATPATAALLRCAYAVPVLVALALLQHRRSPRDIPGARRRACWAALAGLCFAADLVLWHTSIAAVGAGLATVLANAQVVLVPLLAWLLLAERPAPAQFASIPLLVAGTLLIAGVVGAGAYGADPLLGALTGLATAVAYSGFLLALRAGSRHGALPIVPLAIATAVACPAIAAWGLARGSIDLAGPGLAGHAWLLLLALSCQVVAWLLIGLSMTRLSAATVSLVLPVQPVGSTLLGVAIFGEAPSAAQWAGAALTLVGIVVAARAAGGVAGPPAGYDPPVEEHPA